MRKYRDWEIRQGIPEMEAQQAAQERRQTLLDALELRDTDDPALTALMAHYKTARYQASPR